MNSVLPKIRPGQGDERRWNKNYNDVLRYEAKLGGQLFGPVPQGRRREFFCLDRHTWVWHEEWTDQNGQRQAVMTRYHVRPSGILKTQNNQAYQNLSHDELRNFYRAVKLYAQRIPAALRQLQTA
jgi:hypothetical protein